MSFKDKIEIIYIDNVSGNHTAKTVTTINMIKKDDKHREPFNFYLNDEGKLRVFANGFIDATDKTFADYIDNKINEYSLYSGSSTDGSSNSNDNYLKLYGSSNNWNTSLTKKEAAIYEENPSKTSNINNQKSK